MSISLKEFDELCAKLFEQRDEVKRLQAIADEAKDVLKQMEAKVLAHFEDTEMEKHAVKGRGTVYVINHFSVTTPKTIEDKKALGAHLNSRGIFWEYMSVNSQTLNSFYREEMAKAIEAGNVDFKIPGVGEPKHSKTIGMRKS